MRRSPGVAALGWILFSVLATPVPGQTAFDECEALLETEPVQESGPRCFEEVARATTKLRGQAIQHLVRHRERWPEAPWIRFYLGNLWWRAEACTGRAEQAYRAAAAIFSDGGNRDGESRARTNLVLLLGRCGDFDRSRDEIPKADAAVRGSLDPLAAARWEVVKLRLPIRAGGDLEATHRQLEMLWKEKVSAEALDEEPDIASLRFELLRALGQVSVELGNLNEARAWYRERGVLAQEEGDPRQELGAQCDLLFLDAFQFLLSPKIRTQTQRELRAILPRIQAEGEYPEVEAEILLALAKLGVPEAEDYLIRCRRLAEESKDGPLRVRCLLALANHRLEEDPDAARRLLETEALPESREPRALLDSWSSHLRLLWNVYPRDRALAEAEKILQAIERWRDPQTGSARSEVLNVWSDAYYWLAGRLLEDAGADGPRLAFEIMERLRAQELREILLLNDGDGQVPPPPADLLNEVTAALGDQEAMISFHFASWKDFYGRFGGGAWVLTTTRQGTRAHRLEADRVELDSDIKPLIDQQQGPWNPPTLFRLYEALLAPALDSLPEDVEQLLLIPDGILHLLPFAALRPDAETDALGQRFELAIEPSAALWLDWKKKETPGRVSALVLAAPEIPEGDLSPTGVAVGARASPGWAELGPLRYARREGRKVVRHLRGQSQVLFGPKASERLLKRSDLRPYGLLHFATHAWVDSSQPWNSAILLARDAGEDGRLRPDEIATLDLRGKVIILSTCNSAAGRWLRGEGVMSLAHAFFKAGAHAVVGTLKLLEDDLGERFFDDFYRHLSEGLSLRQALAATQSDWARAGLPASTWATVVVLGNGDLVPVPGGVEPSSVTPRQVRRVVAALLLVWLLWLASRRFRL